MPDIILKKVTDLNANDLYARLSLLSEHEKKAIHQVRSDDRRLLKLWAHLTVRQQIADRLHTDPAALVFCEGEHKKPYFSIPAEFAGGNCEPSAAGAVLHFSLSYTTDAAALLISDTPIGLDLEKVRPHRMRFHDTLGTPAELSLLRKSPEDLSLFYEFWTRKEAWLKYTGTGLSVPLNSFDVWQPPLNERLHTQFKDGYCISWCI